MKITVMDNQHFLISGDAMPLPPVLCEILTARCTIHNLAAFLSDLRAAAAANDTCIICFNADMMAGKVHASAAVERAARAFEEGANISNSLEMECLLFAAGSRQCSIASSFGIREGENRVYVCCYPARTRVLAALEPLFRFTEENWDFISPEKRVRLMTIFGISQDEIAAAGGDIRIVDLVLERVALLQVTR